MIYNANEVKIPNILINATADVWYDLIGNYYIYDSNAKEIVYMAHIKDNSDEYKDLAIVLFEDVLYSISLTLLTTIDPYVSLYHVVDNKPVVKVPATKFISYDRNELDFLGIKRINLFEDLNYNVVPDTNIKVPSYLWFYNSFSLSDFGESIFFDDKEERFTNHFTEVCPYHLTDEQIDWRNYCRSFLHKRGDKEFYVLDRNIFSYKNKQLKQLN